MFVHNCIIVTVYLNTLLICILSVLYLSFSILTELYNDYNKATALQEKHSMPSLSQAQTVTQYYMYSINPSLQLQ